MSINLKTCDDACRHCVVKYIDKHKLQKGDQFKLTCKGIPQQYIPDSVLASLGTEPKAAIAMLDPVVWASEFLDWHCLDPDGSVWRRKTIENSLGSVTPFIEEEHLQRLREGKSAYHRPYQATMLRCNARWKIFRIGRQAGKTECLCVIIAWSMFTHENYSVEVIAPYQSQIDLIFGRLSEMISSNATLSNSVARNVKAPNYQIKLKNGSKVTGFTAGTRSGQEAGAARGQHANLLVFDEADYLSPKDIDSALAMIINHPDATVWMSSTPTGRRERFYKNCTDPAWKEFHFPSSINPNYSSSIDEYFRSQLTEDGYKHEVEAEFGEQEEGVYQLKYIEAAQSEYNYGQYKPEPGWTYMMGVDWNDVKIGTTIAVVGFNNPESKWYLVDKAVVSRSENTQIAACNRIAELNRYWNPEYIYVDQGYGATQIEMLHDYGMRALQSQGAKSPDARLRYNVKPYDFGGSREVYDVFTSQYTKKPAKPFLVESSVRRFESYSFKYPKSDTSYTEQLMGYIVDRVSVTGRPVYVARDEKAGDHFLDAVNLALVAFTLEKSRYGKPSYSAQVAIAPRFGEGGREDDPSDPKIKDRGEPLSAVAREHRPQLGRADNMIREKGKLIRDPYGEIPGANMAQTQTKLWAWPGWEYDKAKPKARSMAEATKEAQQRVFRNPSLRNRPRRAKF